MAAGPVVDTGRDTAGSVIMPGMLAKSRWRAAGLILAGLAAVAGMLSAASCRRGAGKRPEGPLRVVVSIAPLKGIVEELAREIVPDVEVEVVVPVGAMEHGFEIPPSMVSGLSRADVVVYVGLGLEPQVEQVLAESRAFRREVCFADVVGIEADGNGHDHAHDDGNDHGHDHAGVDPHLWLDPSLVAKLVPAVGAALADVAADMGRTEAAARLRDASSGPVAALVSRVGDVDAAYEERLRPYRGGVMITAHAAWGRLTDRYGLEQAALAGLEASEPSTAAISRATDLVKEQKAGAIFSEPQINPAVVNRIADLTGAKVFVLDPLGDGDWFKMMRTNLDTLVMGLSQKK